MPLSVLEKHGLHVMCCRPTREPNDNYRWLLFKTAHVEAHRKKVFEVVRNLWNPLGNQVLAEWVAWNAYTFWVPVHPHNAPEWAPPAQHRPVVVATNPVRNTLAGDGCNGSDPLN